MKNECKGILDISESTIKPTHISFILLEQFSQSFTKFIALCFTKFPFCYAKLGKTALKDETRRCSNGI